MKINKFIQFQGYHPHQQNQQHQAGQHQQSHHQSQNHNQHRNHNQSHSGPHHIPQNLMMPRCMVGVFKNYCS